MTVVWGIVGMLVGVLIAAQLYWPALNFDTAWLSFGRLRPLHTNAVIFAFGGCAADATSLLRRAAHLPRAAVRRPAGQFVFWGWQAVIVLAAITLPMGLTAGQGIRRADLADRRADRGGLGRLRRVFFGTIVKRRVHHIYVANWFYGSFIIAVAGAAHRQLAGDPSSLTHSYPIYSGAVDAMVQWWYGHNAGGFSSSPPASSA
jgi:cytochrome c oxidase cbb3-type subunit 1